MGRKNEHYICSGTVEVEKIEAAHTKIREIVSTYKSVQLEVSALHTKLLANWVGKARNEYESQYDILIRKIEDFGDTLADIYDALVETQAAYEEVDDSIRQDYAMAMEE